MGYHSLHTIPLVKQLAMSQKVMENVAKYSGLPRGSVRAVVKDVDDPQERGRVRVLFDAVNFKEVPQVEGAGVYSESRDGKSEFLSHWIDTSPAFKGKQPPGLVGKRVNVVVSNGQYQYAILQDVVHDVELLTSDAASKYGIPNNSSMTRLPVYPSNQLPPACAENLGCAVIESEGPMDSDWMCVCLKRDGEYLWVRHVDLSHGHAGGNDGSQASDSLGNRQNPVMMGTVGDATFPTTAQQFAVKSSYTEKPQGNPKGEAAHWYPPPGSDKVYAAGKNLQLLNPDPNNALSFVRNVAGFPPLDFSVTGFIPNLSPQISTILQPDAIARLQQAQKALSTLQQAGQLVSNPTEAVTNFALKSVPGLTEKFGIPPGTEVALGAMKNTQGLLSTGSLPSLVSSLASYASKGVLSGIQSVLPSLFT